MFLSSEGLIIRSGRKRHPGILYSPFFAQSRVIYVEIIFDRQFFTMFFEMTESQQMPKVIYSSASLHLRSGKL